MTRIGGGGSIPAVINKGFMRRDSLPERSYRITEKSEVGRSQTYETANYASTHTNTLYTLDLERKRDCV